MSTTSSTKVESPFIPLCIPEIRGREWEYVKDCLDSGWVSSVGAYVDRFEQGMATRVGTKYAVATVNGTSALHTSLLVAGIEPGDEVLVSTLTFIAPINAIRYVGAWPVFMDAEPHYWQMDVQKVTEFIERDCQWRTGELRNKVTGRRVRAIIPVHILGHPVDMAPLLELARKYDLTIIEDATESLGALYRETPVGHLGDIACFSFNGNKLITTGGGGMIVTDNENWARKAKYLTTQAKNDPVEFIHEEVGYNYRLTNIQAAMGCAQLELIDTYIAIKRAIAAKYTTACQKMPGISPMQEASWAYSVYWMYTVLVNSTDFGVSSRDLLKIFESNGIQSRPLWQPIHLSPAYQDYQSYYCETATQLQQKALSLPCSVGITNSEQEQVIRQLQKVEKK